MTATTGRILLSLLVIVLASQTPLAYCAVARRQQEAAARIGYLPGQLIAGMRRNLAAATDAQDVYHLSYGYLAQAGLTQLSDGGEENWLHLTSQIEADYRARGAFEPQRLAQTMQQHYPQLASAGPGDRWLYPPTDTKLTPLQSPIRFKVAPQTEPQNGVAYLLLKVAGDRPFHRFLDPSASAGQLHYDWDGLDDREQLLPGGDYLATAGLVDGRGQPLADPRELKLQVETPDDPQIYDPIDEDRLREQYEAEQHQKREQNDQGGFTDYFVTYWSRHPVLQHFDWIADFDAPQESGECCAQVFCYMPHVNISSGNAREFLIAILVVIAVIIAIIILLVFLQIAIALLLALFSVAFGAYYLTDDEERQFERQLQQKLDEANALIEDHNRRVRRQYTITIYEQPTDSESLPTAPGLQ